MLEIKTTGYDSHYTHTLCDTQIYMILSYLRYVIFYIFNCDTNLINILCYILIYYYLCNFPTMSFSRYTC